MTSQTDSEFPVQALEPAKIEVQLGASMHVWTEPGQRACRALLRKFVDVEGKYGVVGSTADACQVLDLADAALDILYGALHIGKDARPVIDDTATPKQIIEGYKAISEVLQRPFAGFAIGTAQVTAAQTIPLPPGETTIN